jgi:hypothetical protein
MPPIRLYRTSDLLVRHRDKIEAGCSRTSRACSGCRSPSRFTTLPIHISKAPPRGTPRPPEAGRKRNVRTVPWSPWAWCSTAAGLYAAPGCSRGTPRKPARFWTCSKGSRLRTAR